MSEPREGEILTPEEIKTVDFYGDPITGALVHIEGEARIFVPLRPLTRFLGLNWSAQYRRALRDEILAPEIRGVAIMATPADGSPSGGTQETLCLPLDLLPGWLFGITTSKVKEEYREKITRYRRECYRRLWEAFAPSILPAVTPPAPTGLSGAQLAYELATAVQNLARDQMEIEARMGKAAQWAKGIDSRVTALELRLEGDEPISETQAADLALAVKTVAQALDAKGTANSYGRVYGELYRRESITSYKTLPRTRFDAVMRWLKARYDEESAET
jgi:hypothetical protein